MQVALYVRSQFRWKQLDQPSKDFVNKRTADDLASLNFNPNMVR